VITPDEKRELHPGDPEPASPTILVRKYGGSSVPSVERIRAVARDICRRRADGQQVVTVVSAMGTTTDGLVKLAYQANPQPPRRELDMLLSVGERIAMSLMSMALAAEGCPAISYTGSQCGIITDSSHTDARIIQVRPDRVRKSLSDGYVVVVAGFQGVSQEKEITTLGRGGSDTTAVALAAALSATRCEILKDVDGVMTADPRRVSNAQRHAELSYRQLREAATSGCGVVHLRAADYAERHAVPLLIGSSFRDGPGTTVPLSAPQAACPPSGSAAPYRPVTMIVHQDIAWIEWRVERVETAQMWLARCAELRQTDPFRTEWQQLQEDRRWGAVAPPAILKPIYDQLRSHASRQGGDVNYGQDYGCVVLVGGQPSSWSDTERKVAAILKRLEVRDWQIRSDGSTLRLLVPAEYLDRILDPLHAEFFPA
jgi:aspartate kinase